MTEHDAEQRIRDLIDRIPDSTHATCAKADLKEVLAGLAEAKADRDAWRNASTVEANGRRIRGALVRRASDALAEMDRRARDAEKTAVAAVYCTWWDAHALLEDALTLRVGGLVDRPAAGGDDA